MAYKFHSIGFALWIISLLASGLVSRAEEAAEVSTGRFTNLKSDYLDDRLQIGLRLKYFTLTEDTREEYNEGGDFLGGFLGSIYKLEEEQSSLPNLYFRYLLNEHISIALGWEEFELKTVTRSSLATDGNFTFSGPSFELEGMIPTSSIATPFASVGIAMLNGGVDYNPEWHRDGLRNFYVDDTTALSFTVGTQLQAAKHLVVDIFARYMDASFDVTYKLAGEPAPRGTYEFPLENWTYGIGVMYAF